MFQTRYTLGVVASVALLLSGSVPALAQTAPPPFPVPPPPNAPLPFVSPIFGDNMVLQRGKPDAIWGWSNPGDTVRVRIGDRSATATAGADHRWQVSIEPPAVGGPYTVTISGPHTVTLHNVLVGDVWLCDGQSNMELPLPSPPTRKRLRNQPTIPRFVTSRWPAVPPITPPASSEGRGRSYRRRQRSGSRPSLSTLPARFSRKPTFPSVW